MLIAFLAAAVLGTGVLAAMIHLRSAVFVLYVWTGLVATLVVPCFWTVLDRSVRVGQAKRMFAAIGAGGVLGALVGSAIASLLGQVLEPRHLVTAGALVFAVSLVATFVLAPHALPDPPIVRVKREPSPLRSRRYLTLLVLVGVVSTITLTIGDLTFKRVLAERIAKDDLATVFGAVYTGLNVIGLVIQLAVTPRLLAKLGVGGALMVLPMILVSTSLGFALTGTWLAILALKLGDGGLRHSLHRVSSEILFLAVPATVRDGAKPVVDAIAQRGGQAAAALIVFAAGALGFGAQLLAAITAAAGAGWLVAIRIVRRAYLAASGPNSRL
jgi:AAA family ATP:ADP antiporter